MTKAPQQRRGSADASTKAPQQRRGSADASTKAPQQRRGSADASQDRETNEKLLRSGIDAYNRGDVAAIVALFDPEVECYVAPGLGNPGTWHGLDGFAEMVQGWREAFAEDRSTVVGTSMPDDHHLIAEMHQTAVGSISGVPVEMTNFYLLEVRDGRAVRFHIYGDRAAALAAASGRQA
jgi:ketosteroid isomerase-like protein